MASLVFMAGSHHVTVRTSKQKRPTGLAAVSWKDDTLNVNVRINGIVHKAHGAITAKGEGYYFWLSAIPGVCGHLNTFKNDPPYPTIEAALAYLAAWIKMEVKRHDNANDGTARKKSNVPGNGNNS